MVVRGKEAEKLLKQLGILGHEDSKYHAKKVVVDGITFDSEREARRYGELMALRLAGEISDLRRQVRYELIPTQYEYYERYGVAGRRLKDGRRCIEKGVDYIADFVYYDKRRGKTIIEDAKGYKDGGAYELFVIKRKLMLYVHKIKIREI